jgi:hypothetical protein
MPLPVLRRVKLPQTQNLLTSGQCEEQAIQQTQSPPRLLLLILLELLQLTTK